MLVALPGSWPAVFSPLALLVTLGVATWITRASRPSTSELYIVTYHSPDARLPLRQVPGRVLGAMTTVSFGGSQGLESASALIGAAFGQLTRRLFRNGFPEEERRALMVCGASAGIAAVFSSPAVGALYGIEIPFRRDVDARRLVPCAVAAASAYAVRTTLVGATSSGRARRHADRRRGVRRRRAAGCRRMRSRCAAVRLGGRAAEAPRRPRDAARPRGRRGCPPRSASLGGSRLLRLVDHVRPGLSRGRLAPRRASPTLAARRHAADPHRRQLLPASTAAAAAACSRRSRARAPSSARSWQRRSDARSRTSSRSSAPRACSAPATASRSPA